MALTNRYVSSLAAGGGDGAIATPWTLDEAIAAATAGDYVWVKADGTYTRTGSDTLIAGTTTSPVAWEGYKTTIGDLSIGGSLYSRTNSVGARVTTNMPLIAYDATFGLTNAGKSIIRNLNITGAISGALVTSSAAQHAVTSCVITNSSTNAAAIGVTIVGGADVKLFDNDIIMSGASGGAAAVSLTTSVNASIIANRITGGPCVGITSSTGTQRIVGNVIYRSSVGIAVTNSGGSPLIENNIIAFCSSDGINIVTGSSRLQDIIGNIITDNTGYGINMVAAGNAAFTAFNRFRANLAATNSGTDWLAATGYGNVTTGTVSDYIDATSNDFRLASNSPANTMGIGGFGIGPYPPRASRVLGYGF